MLEVVSEILVKTTFFFTNVNNLIIINSVGRLINSAFFETVRFFARYYFSSR